MQIRSCTEHDIDPICAIYNHYIATTVISFEKEAVTVEQMRTRFRTYTQMHPWLIGEVDGEIVGYAYATKWRERVAYAHTSEATIYLKPDATGKGYGKPLYRALLQQLEAQNNHVVLGCIALPNEASVRLHEALGFKQVAHFKEVGRKFDRWLDVGYWELIQFRED